MPLPSGIRNNFQKFRNIWSKVESPDPSRNLFFSLVRQAALWVILFAQVVDIESCVDLPLRVAPEPMLYNGISSWDGIDPVDIGASVFFDLANSMMNRPTGEIPGLMEPIGAFLVSHNGWSLFYGSIGDHDPGNINCELLCIKRGVPTNTLTDERRYQIRDAPELDRNRRRPRVVDKGNTYLSRCMTKIHKRVEQYTTRVDEFWLTVRFDVEDLDPHWHAVPGEDDNAIGPGEQGSRFSIHASYANFHEALWSTVKTVPCGHSDVDNKLLPLDLGTVTSSGLSWGEGDGEVGQESRIVICLVEGDARARWLVINGLIVRRDNGGLRRQVLLRCDRCCKECAVKAASGMAGNWLVIL